LDVSLGTQFLRRSLPKRLLVQLSTLMDAINAMDRPSSGVRRVVVDPYRCGRVPVARPHGQRTGGEMMQAGPLANDREQMPYCKRILTTDPLLSYANILHCVNAR
jgi:hypothetical protein